MAYEYEDEVKSVISTETVFSHEETEKEARVKELQEVYRKAKAYDLLKEDLLINEKVFREQAENDGVSDIIHGHYVALLEQSKLERANDER